MATDILPGLEEPATWCLRQGIRASAGSGKTYSLTGQYLRAFLTGSQPAGMLATTFTRKAAGEILGRVLLRLATCCESEEELAKLCRELQLPPMQRVEAQLQLLRLCRALHQVSISTIDSFFGKLLRGYGHELGLAAGTRMLDGESPEITRIRQDAIGELLSRPDHEELLGLFSSLQRGEAKRSMAVDLGNRVDRAHGVYESAPPTAWLPCHPPWVPLNEAEFRVALAALTQAGADGIGGTQAKTVVADAQRLTARNWTDFLGKGISGKLALGETIFNKKEIDAQLIPLYTPLVNHAIASLLTAINQDTAALYQMLGWYHEAYLKLRRQEGVLLFNDVPRELAALLPSQSTGEITHRLDSRIDHLLLDEFQDTNPQQYAILKPFADAIHQTPDADGLIFCVGDLKQSIYGWRGATPEIFARIGTDLPALQWADNDRSWRSSSVVLQAVNQVFGSLTENAALCENHGHVAARWQESFHQHSIAGAERPGYVELLESGGEETAAPDADNDGEEGSRAFGTDPHLEFTAARIKQIARDAPWASIGVLTRTKDPARRMIFALGRIGVTASAEGGSPIADDPAVSIILSALRFADHPSHSAAQFHALNSPLAEALRLRGPAALPRADAAANIRRTLLGNGYAATIGGWAEILAPHCDARGAERLTQLINLADDYGDKAGTRPGEFADFVTSKLVEESAPSQVRVMTVHKAKGLEFDCVVLPELHKAMLDARPRLIYRRDPKTMEIERVAPSPNKLLRALVPELRALHEEHSAGEVSEALCLLYVAMTRARYSLHLIVPQQKRHALSLALVVRHALCSREEEGAAREQKTPFYRHGDEQWFRSVTPPAKTPQTTLPPRAPAIEDATLYPPRAWKRVTPSELTPRTASAAQLLRLDDTEGRLFGSAIHALFSRCGWHGEPLPDDAELLGLARNAARGPGEAQYPDWVKQFRAMTERPEVKAALSPPLLAEGETCDAPWRERRFAVVLDGAMVSGTFDRVHIVRRAGRPVRAELIDFKTDGGNPSALIEHYRPQMETYRQALCRMLQLDGGAVTAKLVLLKAGEAAEYGA